MEFHTTRSTARAGMFVVGAAAITALASAGSATAAVTGTATLKAEGTSIVAVIDATSDTNGTAVNCRLDVTNQDPTSVTKTGFKAIESAAGYFGTLKVENLKPGKYDAKVRCSDSTDAADKAYLEKTGVITVGAAATPAIPTPPVTPASGTTTPDTSGIMALVQQLLKSIFGS